MGMPITVEVHDATKGLAVDDVFAYFKAVDERYSPYKPTSDVSRVNNGVATSDLSSETQWVLELCEQTKQATDGYFDIYKGEVLDPSGLVKGWAIQNAANRLRLAGLTDFYIDAGGDVEVAGLNSSGEAWTLGIRNPFDINTIVKTLRVSNCGVATSGTYIRGQHIYDPTHDNQTPKGVQSITVIGPNIYEADRFATAAFAMGVHGVTFIERLKGFEAYMIDDQQLATYTSGFKEYVATDN